MTTGKRPTIGLFLPDVTEAQYAQVWRGAVDAAHAYEVNLICFTTWGSPWPDRDRPERRSVIWNMPRGKIQPVPTLSTPWRQPMPAIAWSDRRKPTF